MKKALFIFVCFSFFGFAIAQNQDSSKFKLGVSINYFGQNIGNGVLRIRDNKPLYIQNIYCGQYYSKYHLGLNFRGEKFDKINRFNCNFMSSYLLPKNYGSFYEINVTLGHEWYGKKFRHLYYGGELFAGKCKYIYPHGNQNFIENFTEGGLILFSGLKYDINRKLEFRTEFNIMGSVFKRTYGNSIKQNLDLRSLKPISIELYYKF